MSLKFFYSVFFLSFSLVSAGGEIEEIKNYPFDPGAGKLILSRAFESRSELPLAMPPGYSFVPGAGRNGTGALLYERTDPKQYTALEFKIPELSAGQTYEAVVYVRGEKVQSNAGQKLIGGICAEYFRDGKWDSGYYHKIQQIDSSWRKLVLPVTVKPGRNIVVKLYLRRTFTGKIWFDDLVFQTAGSANSIVLNEPRMSAFTGDTADIELSTAPSMAETAKLLVTVENAGKKRDFLLTGKNRVYRGSVGKLEPGPVNVTAIAADTGKRKILWKESFRMNKLADGRAPDNACIIDRHHRTVSGGRLFMPVGIYGFAGEEDLKTISEAGFNTLIVYNSIGLAGAEKTGDRIADIRAGLDRFTAHGLKCIFSLKDQYSHKKAALKHFGSLNDPTAVAVEIVKGIKDHPALLCWYVNDEEQRAKVPVVKHLREAVNAADPWHPTWSLTYRNGDFPYYGISGDIMGVDQSMIDRKKEQSLGAVIDGMECANTTRQPVWIVPQSFCWGVYQTKDPAVFAQSRFPTAGEIRANTLIGAVYGAKGFVFYSYFDMKNRAEKLMPGAFAREWPKVVRTVALLKQLEPYIMSRRKIEFLPVEQTGKGVVKAAVLTADDGRRAVIVIAADENASGKVGLPDGISGSRTFRFAPGAIDAVVLFEKE